MQEIFEAFLSSWLLCFSIVYMWNYLTKRSFQLTNYKLYALTTLLYLAGIVGNNMVVIYLKFLLITTLFAVIYKLFYKSNVQESIITVIFVQLVITISEFIGVFVIGVIFQYDLEKFMNEIFGAAFFNIITIILSILIVKIPIVLKIYNYILDFTKHE